MSSAGRHIDICGTVQGVGFRPWVYRLARELGIRGRVRNGAAGVSIDAYGSPSALETFTERLEHEGPPASSIASLVWQPVAPAGDEAFVIDASEPGGERVISVPADLATCPACLAEVFDPENRRFGYAFTNCTDCGPRFTIVRALPYDRPLTTMAAFSMCPACRHEYESPDSRRFHAQPNACWDCGPRLSWSNGAGDPLTKAARALELGLVVAVKGLGGFHLACDATNNEAVQRLRARKRREGKPLAVMVRNLRQAAQLADIGFAERELLGSVERPIVLVSRRKGIELAADISDTPLIGLFLPYTPLHHLLLAQVKRPLVMTSGNISDEPIVYRNEEALARLTGIADEFLMHDRPIEARCDDSVARVIGDKPVVFRRARGFVPQPVRVRTRFSRPILAVGADLKNAFCLAVGDSAYLGPHIGDLENVEALAALDQEVERLERLLGIRTEVVAYDLHPGYVSTDWAKRRSEPLQIGVQHHHAHVASAMAENGLDGPVLGFAWDGTGWGTDGTAWGGEVLLASYASFERVATFRPIALPGGDRAVRDPWRTACAALDDAFHGRPPLDDLDLFQNVNAKELALVRRMIAAGVGTPLARGVGRWFDAFASIALALPKANYEGQLATRFELIADPTEKRAYRYTLDRREQLWEIDLRPALRRAVRDLRFGVSSPQVSARFHNTLIAAATEVAIESRARFGAHPIVLSGGCFQNARLTSSMVEALSRHAPVFTHSRVPPGDGGIALGQALIADAKARSGSCA